MSADRAASVVVSDRLAKRAKEASDKARTLSSKLDSIRRRVDDVSEVYGAISKAVAAGGEAANRLQWVDASGRVVVAVPDGLLLPATTAVLEVVSGELARLMTELEGIDP